MESVISKLAEPSSGVVISGGASGLGFASARALAAVGRPVALWDLDLGRCEAAAQAIRDEFGSIAIGLAVDVRDLHAIERGAAETRLALPSVGALVHCAGVVDTASIDGMTEQSWDDGIAVHLRALPFLIKAFLPDLQASPGAAVVAETVFSSEWMRRLSRQRPARCTSHIGSAPSTKNTSATMPTGHSRCR